jgi:hypothetical protein
MFEEFVHGSELFEEITVHPDNPKFADENGVLFNKDKTELICYPGGRCGDYVIPASVTKIGEGAFYGCMYLTSVIISDSVVEIGDEAFGGCSGLLSVEIPASVTKISEGMFSDCTNLTSVTIPASVVEIGMDPFDECPAIIKVHPDNPVYQSVTGKLERKTKQK